MKTPAPSELQRWSDEVARDPASLAFLPLARAYRRLGQRSAAVQLCVRGLEHYPTHADAHSLLALLHLENGDRQRAADEWATVLRLDANHFEALRGLGFCYLEQDQLSRARDTLERAAQLRPGDTAVQEALRLLGTRQEVAAGARNGEEPWAPGPAAPAAAAAAPGPAPAAAGWEPYPTTGDAAVPPAAARAPVAEPSRAGAVRPPQPGGRAPAVPDGLQLRSVLGADPGRLFGSLTGMGPLLGALLLDGQGLVLAGSLHGAAGAEAEALGALLSSAVTEADRTVRQLLLGEWEGVLLETDGALVHLGPCANGTIVLLAAERRAPVGWVLRAAAQANEMAARYLEVYG